MALAKSSSLWLMQQKAEVEALTAFSSISEWAGLDCPDLFNCRKTVNITHVGSKVKALNYINDYFQLIDLVLFFLFYPWLMLARGLLN